MKTLKSIIHERLIINKHIKPSFNVDYLTNDDITLYNDQECDDEDMQDMQWYYCQNILDEINNCKDKCGFICTKFKSLGQSKKIEEDLVFVEEDLNNIVSKIINGKDQGYEVKLVGGHLELECINSGSSGTYYIYKLSPLAMEHMEDWWNGDEDQKSLAFLYAEESIVSIEL